MAEATRGEGGLVTAASAIQRQHKGVSGTQGASAHIQRENTSVPSNISNVKNAFQIKKVL